MFLYLKASQQHLRNRHGPLKIRVAQRQVSERKERTRRPTEAEKEQPTQVDAIGYLQTDRLLMSLGVP